MLSALYNITRVKEWKLKNTFLLKSNSFHLIALMELTADVMLKSLGEIGYVQVCNMLLSSELREAGMHKVDTHTCRASKALIRAVSPSLAPSYLTELLEAHANTHGQLPPPQDHQARWARGWTRPRRFSSLHLCAGIQCVRACGLMIHTNASLVECLASAWCWHPLPLCPCPSTTHVRTCSCLTICLKTSSGIEQRGEHCFGGCLKTNSSSDERC